MKSPKKKPVLGKSLEAQRREKRQARRLESISTLGVWLALAFGIAGSKILQHYTYGATTWGDLVGFLPNSVDIFIALISSAGTLAWSEFSGNGGTPEQKALAKVGKMKNYKRRIVTAALIGAGYQGSIYL